MPRPDSQDSTHRGMARPCTTDAAGHQTVVCVGDLHGHIDKTVKLWKALEAELGEAGLAAAHVVFLGDYCDRGPHTREVLDFLIKLEVSRTPGTTTFLAGNHDFAFGCFLGCLDVVPPGFDLDGTKDPRFTHGYWTPDVEGGMHYQGRRWGGDERTDIYDARATFSSYGVAYSVTNEARAALIHAVPETHKQFLRRLAWVYDTPVDFAPGRLICVHAGLFTKGSLEEQLAALRSHRLDSPALQVGGYGRFEALSGRREVEQMHPELEGTALLVSGHHGFTRQHADRLIVDTSGGRCGDEHPIEAVVLPSRRLVSSTAPTMDDPQRRPDRFQQSGETRVHSTSTVAVAPGYCAWCRAQPVAHGHRFCSRRCAKTAAAADQSSPTTSAPLAAQAHPVVAPAAYTAATPLAPHPTAAVVQSQPAQAAIQPTTQPITVYSVRFPFNPGVGLGMTVHPDLSIGTVTVGGVEDQAGVL